MGVVGKSYSSREIIAIIQQDGWFFIGSRGDHHYFKHPTKPGKVTVPHPVKDLAPKTVQSIFKMAGL